MNLKREYFRRKKRRPERSLDAEPVEPAVAPRGAAQVEARRTLARALAELPADQREVIERHWFDGLEFPEVAAVVGASVSAVKVRAHRGYVRLRSALGDDIPAADRNREGSTAYEANLWNCEIRRGFLAGTPSRGPKLTCILKAARTAATCSSATRVGGVAGRRGSSRVEELTACSR